MRRGGCQKGKIHRLYTLFNFDDENSPPQLPFPPVHRENAFIEDEGHDWTQWLLAELK